MSFLYHSEDFLLSQKAVTFQPIFKHMNKIIFIFDMLVNFSERFHIHGIGRTSLKSHGLIRSWLSWRHYRHH